MTQILYLLPQDEEDYKELKQMITEESEEQLSRYEQLNDKNSDCVGWITIENTTIDYPIMYTPLDEKYYLRRNFEKEESKSGVPFISENCSLDSENLIIYGHNMSNGTMFAPLLYYDNSNYFKNYSHINLELEYQSN